ncbi:MAG: alpha/beta hydrolase [Actinomycetota bacterium]|nr:alpha/beta hydrolase [Actinomycetota bacterium]
MPKFVWAHAMLSSVRHEDALGLFDWRPAAKTSTIVRYDARGHGTAVVQYEDRAYRWSALVDDMLREAGDGPFVAAGAGMGAATALLAAVRAPRRVAALILAIPPAAWENRSEQVARYRALAENVERRRPGSLLAASSVIGQPQFVTRAVPGTPAAAARQVLTMDRRAVPAILRGAALSDLASRDEIRSVIVPTLILAWEDDPGHPIATAETLATLMLQSELHVAGDIDAVRSWPKLVCDFLATV